MNIIFRGISILGMLIVFFMLTACTPNRALTRDRMNYGDSMNQNGMQGDNYSQQKNENEYVFDSNEWNSNNERSRYNKKGDARERENYSPASDTKRFDQTGLASWYGREFHSRMTASGERFDMYGFTAAHRTLPFGTMLEVTNLDNGKTVKVKVNDRGPYKKDRLLDLSFAAGKKLDMISKGEVQVGINIIGKQNSGSRYTERPDVEGVVLEENRNNRYNNYEGRDNYRESPKYNNASSGQYALQAGAFYSKKKASDLKHRIESIIEKPVIIIKDNYFYKVRIKNIHSRGEAKRVKRMLIGDNIPSYVIDLSE